MNLGDLVVVQKVSDEGGDGGSLTVLQCDVAKEILPLERFDNAGDSIVTADAANTYDTGLLDGYCH